MNAKSMPRIMLNCYFQTMIRKDKRKMKKRIAYLGISYPLLYDYVHMARSTQNDLSDSPNPIIESPLGLMILYDELWFLCESLCPNNMRKLPYVKFVDRMFPDIYLGGADEFHTGITFERGWEVSLSYGDILRLMKLERWNGLDNHTHGLEISDIKISANSSEDKFLLDLYVLSALQEQSSDTIELVSNSLHRLKNVPEINKEATLTEKILIRDIPNYLTVDGPYHECMEELRGHEYLRDFRKWIIENHDTITKKEIEEMSESVQRTMQEAEKREFRNYLERNKGVTFWRTSGQTIFNTIRGVKCPLISVADAMCGITLKGKEAVRAKGERWQGFVMDAQEQVF